ncbi:hypothetical protein JW777_04755 [bacterium]|nr:hypothetical protein [bacterium]
MIATINEWAGLWWAWMAPMFWQVSLLIVLIGILDWAGRRWVWPQVRYAVWLLVLLKLLLPPTLASPVSVFSRIEPGLRSAVTGTAVEKLVPAASSVQSGPETARSPDLTPFSGAASKPPASAAARLDGGSAAGLTGKTWAFLVWISGMAVFALLLILKMARLRRWHRMHRDDRIPDWFYRMLVETANTLRLGRVPAIVFAPDAATPAVYGMFRPVLLLPSGYLKNLSREEARHVLLHELSHLKRGDLWTHGLYLVLHVVYWFNPLLIWARRQMKHVREICCDLSVAGVLREKTRGYRDTLLNTAKDLLTENVEPGLGLLGVFEEPFRLVSRLKWLEKDVWKRGKWITVASVSASVCAAAAFLPMSPRTVSLLPDEPSPRIEFSTEAPVAFDVGASDSVKASGLRFRVEKTEPATVVILPKIGFSTFPSSGVTDFETALSELQEFMRKQGIKARGEFFMRVWTDGQKVPKSWSIWEVGCPVSPSTEAKPPLETVHIPRLQQAVVKWGYQFFSGLYTRETIIKTLQDSGWIPAFPPVVTVFRNWDESEPPWTNMEWRIQVLRPGESYPGLDVKIRETEAVTALVLPMTGPYSQFDGARERMKRCIRENGLKTTDRWFRIFHSDPSKTAPDAFQWEIGCELEPSPGSEILRVDPPFGVRHQEKDSLACSSFSGPLNTEFPFMPFIWQVIFKGHMIAGPLGQSWEESSRWGRMDVRNQEWFVPVTSDVKFAQDMQAFGAAMASWEGQPVTTGQPDQDELRRSQFETRKTRTDRSASSGAASGTVSGAGTARGYRVQLVSTTEEKISQKTWNEAMSKLKTPVYLIFEPPNRMIRVGDCRTFEEAEILLKKAVKNGFTNASIIRSDIAAEVSSMGNSEAPDSVPGWKERLSGFFSGFSAAGESKPLFRVESTNPYWAVLLPAGGSMAQHEAVFEKLRNYMAANGIPADGTAFTRQFYNDQTVNTLELRWEACFPVKDSVAVKAPFRCLRIPARSVIRIHFTNNMDQKALNVRLASWMIHNDYSPKYPNVMIWVSGVPSDQRIPERIEIEIPVEKRTDPLPEVRIFTRSNTDRQELLLPMTGSWKQEDEAIRRLNEFVRRNRIETLDNPFVQYHTSPEITPEQELVWEAGIPVKGEIKVEDPFRIEWRRGRETACTAFTGDHTDIPVVFWHSYMLNLTANGYFLSGYPRKVFREKLSDRKWKVELEWGVTR